jgi:hypothetical protein
MQPEARRMPQTAQQVLEEALAKGIPINVGGDEMMSLAATCIFFGGDKPLNPSTREVCT